jgi:hypothetical protein
MRSSQSLKDYLSLLEKRENIRQRDEIQETQKKQIERLQQRIKQMEDELISDRYLPFSNLSKTDIERLKQYVHSDAEVTLSEIKRIQENERRLEEEIEDHRFDTLRDAPEDTGEKLKRLRDLTGERKECEQSVDEHRKKGETPARVSIWFIPIGLFLIAGVIGGILGAIIVSSLQLSITPVLGIIIGFGLLGIAAGLIGMIIALWLRKRPDSKAPELIAGEVRLEKLLGDEDAVREELEAIFEQSDDDDSVDVLIERWGNLQEKREELQRLSSARKVHQERDILKIKEDESLKNLIESESSAVLKDRLNGYESLLSELKTKQETLIGLSRQSETEGTSDSNTHEQMKEVLLEMRALEEQYPTFSLYRKDAAEGKRTLEVWKRELTELEKQRDEYDTLTRQADRELASFSSSSSANAAWLEEQIERKQEELRRFQLQRDALEIAIQILDEAIQEFEGEHLERLTTKTSKYFNQFTQQRYKGVTIGAGQNIQVIDRQGETFDVSLLSTGAKDQLFLALRLAIVDLLSADNPIPLVLDDSFVNFDSERLQVALEVVSTISKERQVILLSHDEVYKDWADEVITL